MNYEVKLDLTSLFSYAYIFLFLSIITYDTNINSLLGDTATDYAGKILYGLFLTTCACMLITKTYNGLSEIIITLFVIMIGFVCYQYSEDYTFLNLFLLACASQDVDVDDIINKIFAFQLTVILIIIGMALLGIIQTGSFVRSESSSEIVRNALGFRHPNMLGLFVFQLIAEYLYIRRKDYSFRKYIISLSILIVTYVFANSNTSLLVGFLLITGIFLYECLERNSISVDSLKKLFLAILVVTIFIIAIAIRYYWFHPTELAATTLAKRITLAQDYITAYGLNLFGQTIISGNYIKLPNLAYGYYYLDNAQVWGLLKFGLISNVIFYYLLLRYIMNIIRRGEITMLLIVMAYLIYSLVESETYMVPFNFTLLYIAAFNNNGYDEEKVLSIS